MMKFSKKEWLTISLVAVLTGFFMNLSACSKSEDSDDAPAATPIAVLALNLNASCDGEACL